MRNRVTLSGASHVSNATPRRQSGAIRISTAVASDGLISLRTAVDGSNSRITMGRRLSNTSWSRRRAIHRAVRQQTAAEPVLAKTTYKTHAGVDVRVGKHCDFDRVVFDWPKPVGYKVKRYGNEITINFDRDSSIDVSSVRKGLGRFILDARSEKRETGSSATLVLASDVKDRVWDWDHRVIIDGQGAGCY